MNETCEYLHSSENVIGLWLDGPCTCLAALMSAVGTCCAIRFLRETRLNKNMAAALYALCVVDFMVMMVTVLFLSVEATSILFTGANFMYNKQSWILLFYGMRNSLVMCSTMLVIYITYIRFLVVTHPLKFASSFTKASRGRSVSKLGPNPTETSKCSVSYQSDLNADYQIVQSKKRSTCSIRKMLKPFTNPFIVIIFCFMAHTSSYMEFGLMECFDDMHQVLTQKLKPSHFKSNNHYLRAKAIFTSLTETIGPMCVIFGLSLFTEYRIHANVQARRRLFENQRRKESDELRDKASKALAVFIVVKFLIFRSLPTFIDVYDIFYSSKFSEFMTVVTRISDFLVVLNSATNPFAYFGKNTFEKCFHWCEARFCTLMMPRKEDSVSV